MVAWVSVCVGVIRGNKAKCLSSTTVSHHCLTEYRGGVNTKKHQGYDNLNLKTIMMIRIMMLMTIKRTTIIMGT